MSFEARNALMLAKKVVDKAAEYKKIAEKAEGGATQGRKVNKVGLFSKGAEQARKLPQAAPAPQLISTLINRGGVKQEELQNAGLLDQQGKVTPEWASHGKMTPDELAEHLHGALPQVEEKVLGGKTKISDKQIEDEYRRIYGEPRTSDGERLSIDEMRDMVTSEYAGVDSPFAPKYRSYTLPGGQNYREVLLKLNKGEDEAASFAKSMREKYGDRWLGLMTPEEFNKYGNLIDASPDESSVFKSPHWDDPNVLAHIRMADRTGPNGEKILHVEEVQSDWGQKGKKEGFHDPNPEKEYKAYIDDMRKRVREQSLSETVNAGLDAERAKNLIDKMIPTMKPHELANYLGEREILNDKYNKVKESSKGIPSAPYVTSTQGWTDLALKRILKEAAEGGYDKVVWTPGDEQAKRYDLSKHISELHLEDGPRGEQMLRAYSPSGDHVINRHIVDAEKELPDIIGKEATQKLLSQEPSPMRGNQGPTRSLIGEDLSVGGEGMKGYYDNILPKRLQAIAQKHDKTANIGKSLIKTHGDEWPFPARIAHDGENYWVAGKDPRVDDLGEKNLSPKYKTYEDADNHRQLLYAGYNQTVPSLDITPKMRESILKGQEGFARGGDVERDGYKGGGSPDLDMVREALERVAHPLSRNPELAAKATQIASQSYKVPTTDVKEGPSYYGSKGPMNVTDIKTTLEPLPGVNPLTKKPMTWEEFYKIGKGGSMINLGGDRSRLGRLTHINNKQLAWPVDLHAGSEYMLEPNPEAVWANAPGHTTNLRNAIIRASKEGPVFGVYTPMGPKTVDSSFQMFDALLAQIAAEPPSKKTAKQFDDALKDGRYVIGSTAEKQKERAKEAEKMADWPGILNTLEAREHVKKLPGSTRSLIVKYLDRAAWNKAGFPNVGVTRAAITNPDLLTVPANMMGHRIVRLSPDEVEETAFKHNTYTSPTAGTYEADVPLVQRQYATPDVTEKFLGRRVGQNKDVIMHPYSTQSGGRDAYRKMLEEQKQLQPINQKMLDSIQQGLEEQPHYGFARGGEIYRTPKVKKPHAPVVGEKLHGSKHPAMMIPGIHVIEGIHGIPYFTGKK